MTYVVQPGDTLYAISLRFNTTINEILAANPQITNPNLIFPGQIIEIPAVTPPTEQCPILRQGDQGPSVRRLQILLMIAGFNPGPIDGIYGPRTQAAVIAFQQTIKELEVTGFVNSETWVALGAECEPIPTTIRYVIRPGDTLFIIATRFNITIAEILRVNPNITNPNVIFAGTVINIPPRR